MSENKTVKTETATEEAAEKKVVNARSSSKKGV